MSAATEESPARRGTDRARRHNLGVVLEAVHRSRGVSRSHLTRQTGLNRSTVAALVAELVELQLVVESEPGAGLVGRPSPIVRPTSHLVGFAVNPEVDAITVGLVTLGGTVLKRVRQSTGHTPSASEAVDTAARIIERMRGELEGQHCIAGIGVAVPGLVSSSDGVVRLAPHLGWVDEPLGEMLRRATGLRVVAGNDATLGSLAESTFGAGRGASTLIYLNGGASGIGGGVIAYGAPFTGVGGYAGEFGHTLVSLAGKPCHCGATGCLETEASRQPLLDLVGLEDADSDQLEQALLEASSPDVLAEVHRQLDFVGVALRNAINILNPELIVLGGFLGSLYAVAPDYLDELVAAQPLRAARENVRISRAMLGSDLLMIGAAELAFETVLADPASVLTLGQASPLGTASSGG